MEETITKTRIFRSGGFRGEIKEKDGVLESVVISVDSMERLYQRIVLKDSYTEKYGGALELSDLLELVKIMLEAEGK